MALEHTSPEARSKEWEQGKRPRLEAECGLQGSDHQAQGMPSPQPSVCLGSLSLTAPKQEAHGLWDPGRVGEDRSRGLASTVALCHLLSLSSTFPHPLLCPGQK